ncbi:MAG: mechanosensitive ion channel family protein [Spirulinaceae cyanobacterium]
MLKKYFTLAMAIAATIILMGGIFSPVQSQLPRLDNLNLIPYQLFKPSTEDPIVPACIRLDGRCLFKVAAPESEISDRVADIEQRLRDVRQIYLTTEESNLEIRPVEAGKLEDIYAVGNENEDIRLLTITVPDAELQGVDVATRAKQIVEDVEVGLKKAQQERETSYLTRQGGIAGSIFFVMIALSWLISRWQSYLKRSKDKLKSSAQNQGQPISTQLTNKQDWNFKEIQVRLLELGEFFLLGGGGLYILGLFPYTRTLQIAILAALKIPFRVGLVILGTYLTIRLVYVLISKFAAAIAENSLLIPESTSRLQLRISTISRVTKGIATITCLAAGIVVALAWLGVDIAPLLAGAGIIGVALSFASQNIIKDALNGFFIILEDQFAVGDVITVGDVGGLVENMNLRITQLRDAEGRLITVPNSEIKIVANHSNGWSRADVSLPISYRTDVDKAIAIVNQVAQDMDADEVWQEQILEPPQVLGVDGFGDRGVILRIWLKTQTLKQWDVAREYRRRLKIALDEAGISIPVLQQEILLRR